MEYSEKLKDPRWQKMIVTFGKYKGKPLCEIPKDYLVWCVENFDSMRPGNWKRTFKRELERRETL